MGATTSKTFYTADIATIASTADSAASAVIDVPANATEAYVQLYLTGHATGAGNASAYVVMSLDGTNYSTDGISVIRAIASGAKRSNVVRIMVKGVSKIKVLKITNGDPAQAITAVNVIVTFW